MVLNGIYDVDNSIVVEWVGIYFRDKRPPSPTEVEGFEVVTGSVGRNPKVSTRRREGKIKKSL